MTTTQRVRILAHLQNVGPLTTKQAQDEFGCYRLSERIRELRGDGHEIDSQMVKVPTADGETRVAQYTLLRHKDQGEMGI